MAVGAGGIILTSEDGGVTWTERSFGTTYSLEGVTYGNGIFVAVGYGGIIVTSVDGINWTQRTSGTSNSLNGVTYGNGIFVIVGSSGTILQNDQCALFDFLTNMVHVPCFK